MASASNLITNPAVSKTFDFASADVFCPSYCDELSHHDNTSANGLISDPSITDFHKSRIARMYSPTAVYDHPHLSLHRETINAMESCVKRHTDDVMRFLEGISSRLSHLESYCYNVDKSVGEMRSNLSRDYEETDSKLTSLEKKLVDVGRSVQILRDKKDLAETQKELAKLQMAKKKLSSPNAPRQSVQQSTSPISDTSEVEKQHVAIILSQQGTPQPHLQPVRSVEVPRPVATSENAPQQYYVTSAPLQVNAQASQGGQYLRSDSQCQSYQSVQQDINLVRLRPVSAQVSQQGLPPLVHRFVQYQQPWQQPQHQQMYPSTLLSSQKPPAVVPSQSTQVSTHLASGHLPRQPCQNPQQPPQEAVSVSSSVPDMSSQVASHVDVLPNGYVRRQTQPQPLTQQIKTNYASPLGNGYASAGQHHSLSSGTYMMYRNEDVMRQPPYQSQGSYAPPPANVPAQHPQHTSLVRNQSQPQFARNYPHTDLTEKLVNMGFRADHVVATIHKMEGSGQAVDFNAVADTMNVQSSGFHRGWTG